MTAVPRPPAPPRYAARLALTEADLSAAQALRHLCFVAARGRPPRDGALDRDAFDPGCEHVLIEAEGRLVACFRLRRFADGRTIGLSYAAQFYDLAGLSRHGAPLGEVGRFCVHPGTRDPDVMRLAWATLAGMVDAGGIAVLFGCSSFEGTDPAPYRAAFAHLAAAHAAPPAYAPGPLAAERVALAGPVAPDRLSGLRAMPPLLRRYLAMGGWVGDHAVVDRDLGTLHVFTAVETARVPTARALALRALGAPPPG